jgi:ribosomal protein S18 acetylase RimI-like enzyme
VPAAVEVRPTIDRRWLERAASLEPLTHAFALWDLDWTPSQVRFASAVRDEETVGYILIWLGQRGRPVVHWFGAADLAGALLRAFPTPPFLAVVPPEVEPAVVSAFPGSERTPLKMMLREPGWVEGREGAVRRLGREDRAALSALVRARGEEDLGVYVGLDPEAEPVWGAFDGGRLVGVARAGVRLPRIWVLGGVFVEPDRRGRGVGQELVAAVVREAERSGARAGLYVREDPPTALRLYERLGFREIGRRSWLSVRKAGSS